MTAAPEHFLLPPAGWVPNNPRLPVLLYRGALDPAGGNAAGRFEEMFAANGWRPDWRDVFYPDHHYHSTAHEALGIAGGSARLMLGGEAGTMVEVAAGDVLVLPVGIGHRGLEQSADLLVVGAYPDGQQWDDCRSAPSAEVRRRIDTLALPMSDPVEGDGGPLRRLWALPRAPDGNDESWSG